MLKKYHAYFKERFPFWLALICAGVLYYSTYFFTFLFSSNHSINQLDSLLTATTVFMILLHLRILDDYSDYTDDCIAHPERALSRGVITLSNLRKLLAIIFLLEAAINLYLETTQLLVWLAIIAWSFLMFKHFFVPDTLRRRPGLFNLSHQMVLPLICTYIFIQHVNILSLKGYELLYLLVFLLISFRLAAIYKVLRKVTKVFKNI